MHPYQSADIAAAHMADLLREAAATCCRRVTGSPVLHRIHATVQRATAGLRRRAGGTAPACCPA